MAIAGAMGLEYPLYHVGLLWNPDTLEPDPWSYRNLDDEMWHNAVAVTFPVDGIALQAVTFHLRPFGRYGRADEGERLAAFVTGYPKTQYSIAGGDRNSILADRVLDADGTWRYYHPDPFAHRPWSPEFIHQCQWEDDESGQPSRWWADRRPGKAMHAAGLQDTDALVNKPWSRTVGHYFEGGLGDRAIDGHQVTEALASTVVDHEIIDNELTRAASDHLPVVTTLDLSLVEEDHQDR